MDIRRRINELEKQERDLIPVDTCVACGRHGCWKQDGLKSVLSCTPDATRLITHSAIEDDPPCTVCGYFPLVVRFNIERANANASTPNPA